MNIENSTNQLQHPYYGMGAAHKLTVSLQNPNNLVLIEPSSVHNTHTHFYQTNYRREPFETRREFVFMRRHASQLPAVGALLHNNNQFVFEILNKQFVLQFQLFYPLEKFYNHDKNYVTQSDATGVIVNGWRGTGDWL